jgi:hypothetical protein
MNKDWNQQEDPLFEQFNNLTLQKISQIEAGELRKGKTITEEHKKIISQSSVKLKGRVVSEETKQKISKANKGKKHSYKKRKEFSEEHRKKLGDASRGKKRSDEVGKKISEAKLKPYAIYQGQVYNTKELTSLLEFNCSKKLSKIKAGLVKNIWEITFL